MKTISKILSVLLVLAMVLSFVPVISAEETTETMSIVATGGTLVGKTITWTSDNFEFKTEQGGNNNPIRTSDTDHFRVYQDNKTTISALNGKKISKIVVTCDNREKKSSEVLKTSASVYNPTVDGSTVTLTFAEAVESVSFSASGQWRLNNIAVTFASEGGSGSDSGSDTETELPFANGDKIVIYNPAHKKALSSLPDEPNSYYQKGVDVTLADGKLTGYADTEVWTVVVNEDGTVSFEQGGKKLGMQATYSSMSLGAVNDKWELVPVSEGLYLVKNVARGNCIEWYASKNNWSTYTGTGDLFNLSFYVITAEPTTPDEPSQTGDASMIVAAAVVAVMSAAGMALLLKKKEF